MKWKVLFVVALLGALAWPSPGHAEKVKANQSTKLFSRAGEQSPVILKLKAGQSMTLLAKDGRWIKVRVSGRTGWIPRSKVDMPDDDGELARNTRRRPFVDGRGTKRGFGGEGGPDDRIGADATGDGEAPAKPARGGKGAKASDDDDDGDKPSARGKKSSKDDDGDAPAKGDKDGGDDGDAEPVRPTAHVAKATDIYNDPDAGSGTSFTAQPRTALYVGEEKGKWTFVENDEGEAGFVQTSKLDVDTPAAGGPRTRRIDLRGGLSVTLVNQSVSTPGAATTVPDNYHAGASSGGLALGAKVLYPYQKRYWLGGDFSYDFDRTLFGGIEDTRAGTKTTTSFSFHNFNLRALGGYDLQNKYAMVAFARLGFHYDSFQVSDVANFSTNTAKIPNQIIEGPTLGGGLAIPRLTSTLGIEASLDLMLLGASVQQTKNLEDGTGPGAKAVYFGGVLNYRWKPKMTIQGILDLGYTSLSFSGPAPPTSMRGHTGTGVSSGSDLNVMASVGIAYAL